jgi:hypothetical protein
MDVAVSRKEDMSAQGQLGIVLDADGDIHVSVFEDDGDGNLERSSSVVFCDCGIRGGRSPRTMNALRELKIAMELDNKEHANRAGDF